MWYPTLKDERDTEDELTVAEVREFIPNMRGRPCTFEHIPTAVIGTIEDAWLEGRSAFVKFDLNGDEAGGRARALINDSLRTRQPLGLSATHLILPNKKRSFVEMSVVSKPRRQGARVETLTKKLICASAIGHTVFPGATDADDDAEDSYTLVTASFVPLEPGTNGIDDDASLLLSHSPPPPPRATSPPPIPSTPIKHAVQPLDSPPSREPLMSSSASSGIPTNGIQLPGAGELSTIVEQMTNANMLHQHQQQQQQHQQQQQQQHTAPAAVSSLPAAPTPTVPVPQTQRPPESSSFAASSSSSDASVHPIPPFPGIDGITDTDTIDALNQIWMTPGLSVDAKNRAIAAMGLRHLDDKKANEDMERDIHQLANNLGENANDLLRLMPRREQREVLLKQLKLRDAARASHPTQARAPMGATPPPMS